MTTLFPTPADDSEFSFFEIILDNSIVNVSIACELIDRLAGRKLGERERLDFLREHTDFFSGAAKRKARRVGLLHLVELAESDFPNEALQSGLVDDALARGRQQDRINEAQAQDFRTGEPTPLSLAHRDRDF
jgi:hypothetical protein